MIVKKAMMGSDPQLGFNRSILKAFQSRHHAQRHFFRGLL